MSFCMNQIEIAVGVIFLMKSNAAVFQPFTLRVGHTTLTLTACHKHIVTYMQFSVKLKAQTVITNKGSVVSCDKPLFKGNIR